MIYLTSLIPHNSPHLRGTLNNIADWSEQGTYGASLKARSVALAIPIFALAHVPVYAARGLFGSLHLLIEGEIQGGFFKLINETSDALKSLAFAVASIAWSVSGIFVGSWALVQLRTNITRDLSALEQQLIAAEAKQKTLQEQWEREIAGRDQDLVNMKELANEHFTALTAQIEAAKNEITDLKEKMGKKGDAVKNLQEKVRSLDGQLSTLKVQYNQLWEQHRTLRNTHKVVELNLKKQREENIELLAQVESLRGQIDSLGQENGKLKRDYSQLLSHLEEFKGKTEAEKRDLIQQLQKQGEQIDANDKTIQDMLRRQEELEMESLYLKGFVIVEDLEKSSHVTPPSASIDVFGTLHTHLVEHQQTLYAIENKGTTVTISQRPVDQMDPFTASCLTFLLLKGYDKFGQRQPAEFAKILEGVEKTFGQFKGDQREIEYLTLRETIQTLRDLQQQETDLAPQKSVESLIDLITGRPTQTTLRHPFIDAKLVVIALKERFGSGLVDAALGYYGIGQSKLLTERDVAMIVVSIAANIDLESAKQFLKVEEEQELIQGIGKLRESALDFTKRYTLTPSLSQTKQFKKDVLLLDSLVKVGRPDTSTAEPLNIPAEVSAKLAAIEYLGRDLVYNLFDPAFSYYNMTGGGVTQFYENMVVTVAGLDNTPRLFKVQTLVREGGIYGVVLVPVNPQPNDKVIVLFRGTFDLASICRDLGFWEKNSFELGIGGPGARSFEDRKNRILENFNQFTQGLPLTEMIGIGHSLGGSDIARFTEALLTSGHFSDNFKEVDLVTFNAPHVEDNTHKRFVDGVRRHPSSSFAVTHLEGEGDVVPLAGIRRIAGDRSSLSNLTTDTVTFAQSVPAKQGPYEAHTSYWLTQGGDPTLSRLSKHLTF